MSHRYLPVGWTRSKLVYDAVLLGAVAAYILGYMQVGPALQSVTLPLDGARLGMQAYGSCALLLLTFALCIGPLARLDPRFLPLLYNRRHLGVITFAVALGHALQVLGWYFAFSPTARLVGLLGADTAFGRLHGFPFIPLGIAALLILGVLAATSHDFWLSFLTPPLWKAIHMGIYPAYALVVAHVGLGALQDARSPVLAVVLALCVVTVCGLHLAASARGREADAGATGEQGWVDAGPVAAVEEGRAIILRPEGGEAVAIFRHAGRLSAVSNLCAHQNGPLGEGRVIDGCITCPWHGFQYRLEDGCAPPPYTERIATYNVRVRGGRVLLDPRPNPLGTRVEPVPVAGGAA
jgi:nitrite reductase/ring-hydroxylating ferredoxin subunit/DMSO/TMAO reductase YedYZ heme-binding membrane subunit